MASPQLRIPGPTPLPERVLRESARQMINHRGPEFARILSEVTGGVQRALRTQNEVLFFPASGSGGLEAAVVNTVSPGEPALFCSMGSFGKRWMDIAAAYGVDVRVLKVAPGQAITADAVDAALTGQPEITTVFFTHNETSTGVTNDVAAIAGVARRHGKLICVDSVSGAPCLPLDVDGLALDVVVCGSQKGWMAPPGVTMLAVSARAFEKCDSVTTPRWYLDFRSERNSQIQGQTATTPVISVFFALAEGLTMIDEEGLENSWARHRRVAQRIRDGVEALDLTILAEPTCRSDTVTAIKSPAGSPDSLRAFLGNLRDKHALVLAGGQGDLKGHIFRIGHLGYIEDADVEKILDAIAEQLVADGLRRTAGAA